MALRSLLRRIPVRSPSGPRMGPVRGVSPAPAASASRFMATQSEGEQRLSKAFVEQEKSSARLWDTIKANNEEFVKAHNKLRNEQAAMKEDLRRGFADLARYGRKWRMFGNASAAAMLASTVLLVYWAHEA